jgi:hypothetical protein
MKDEPENPVREWRQGREKMFFSEKTKDIINISRYLLIAAGAAVAAN